MSLFSRTPSFQGRSNSKRQRPASDYTKRCSCDLPSRLNTADTSNLTPSSQISSLDLDLNRPPPSYEEIDSSLSSIQTPSIASPTPTATSAFRASFYSTLSTSTSASSTSQKPWHYNHKSNFRSYWTRNLPQDTFHDEIWHEYGVSSGLLNHDLEEAPECYFTCKRQTKPGVDKQKLDKVCRFIAQGLRMHRAEHGCLWPGCCRCTFVSLKECEQARGGQEKGLGASGRGLYKKWTKGSVGFAMGVHDRMCSCGCFDQ